MAENQVKPLNMRESMDLMDQIVDAVRMVGGNDADLRLLSRSSSARRRVARIIKGEETDQIYRTKIRYGMSYQDRVKSCVDLQEHKRSVDTPWELTICSTSPSIIPTSWEKTIVSLPRLPFGNRKMTKNALRTS